MEGFQVRRMTKTGSMWSEDRKKEHMEQMKEYWKKMKEQRIENQNWHVVLRLLISKINKHNNNCTSNSDNNKKNKDPNNKTLIP